MSDQFFTEKLGYRVTLNPQGRVVAKLVNKQLGHIVHITKTSTNK